MVDRAAIGADFERVFGAGGRVHLLRAPGRVNLIGEHTDYNEGFVLPMAIEPQLVVACRGRDDGKIRVASDLISGEPFEFSVNKKIEPGEPAWSNYVRGVAAGLIGAGVPLPGMDALLSSTIPVGSGLSSSAAIEVGTCRALLHLAGLPMEGGLIATICQRAEQEYAGVPCGIMDQTIVALARANHAILLDCRDFSRTYIPLDGRDLQVVIVDSLVKHQNAAGAYAQRRKECEEGLSKLRKITPDIKALRDVSMEQLEAARSELGDVIYRRCRHVITENARTTDAAQKLSRRFYDEAGLLMVESHQSLRDDYEVSCPQLDLLAEQAMKVGGVYGARMTGAGFGGCIVALAIPRAVENLKSHLIQAYQKRYGKEPGFFVTGATAGAGLLI
jgi:galactokinase